MSDRYNAIREERVPVHERMIIDQVFRSCLNCEQFTADSSELCMLAKARPPAKVIVYGCQKWEASIPF